MSATYPGHPGHRRDNDTSIAAAEDIATSLGRLQKMTLDAIGNRCGAGLTADECATDLQLQRWTVQPGVAELRRKGLIIDSGKRRRNVTGKQAIVWVLSKYGELPH